MKKKHSNCLKIKCIALCLYAVIANVHGISVPISAASNCTNWDPSSPPSRCSYTKTATRVDQAAIEISAGTANTGAGVTVNCPNCDRVDDNNTCGNSVSVTYTESFSESLGVQFEVDPVIDKLKGSGGLGLTSADGTQVTVSGNCSFTPPECTTGERTVQAKGFAGKQAEVTSDYSVSWVPTSNQPKLIVCKNYLAASYTADCDSVTSSGTGDVYAEVDCGQPTYTDCTNPECDDDDDDNDPGD